MNQANYSDLFSITDISPSTLLTTFSSERYHILLLDGKGTLSIDFIDYKFDGKVIFFTSPYQHFKITTDQDLTIKNIDFHSDFYCIEYHKKEVACNGLLFNNIYFRPIITLNQNNYEEIMHLGCKLTQEIANENQYSEPILKAYLQLILAISSKIKSQELDASTALPRKRSPIEEFKPLLEQNYIMHRKASFYANKLALSTSVFTKQCKSFYGKTPSQLIQERVILEAKKLIHLTYKNFKEIASLLNFEDEHYFSRYFKKNTGITPTLFRKKVGVSIVAKMSNK